MEVIAAPRMGVMWSVLRAARLGVVAAGIGGAALAGGLGNGPSAAPPRPVLTAAPTPTPSPEPTPSPSPSPVPTPVTQIASPEVREAEQRLSDLGYWTGPIDGVLDGASRHAVMAFQKVQRRARTGRLTPDEIQAIRTAGRPSPRVGGYRHVEIDLQRQVLFVVDSGGAVSKVIPVSSGNGKAFTSQGWTRRAVTPRGRFTVYRKISGWRKSPLGLLFWPNYIVGGIAIHGAPSVPAYPASHGCIRIPIYAAIGFSGMAPVGTVVIVHDGGPLVQEGDVASPPGQDNPDAAVPASPPPTPNETPAPTPAFPPPRTPRPPDTPRPLPTESPEPSPSQSPGP